MALFSQSLLGLGAPDCPVAHWTVSSGEAGSSEQAALGTSTAVYG
jgi:hypothetical protein